MTSKSIWASILIAICFINSVASLSTPPTTSSNSKCMDRISFLQTACTGLATVSVAAFSPPNPAFAKSVDPAVKGTKSDPAFESCLSVCVFECTKPKGEEQKTRKECYPECKKKCATTKEQLLNGKPIKQE